MSYDLWKTHANLVRSDAGFVKGTSGSDPNCTFSASKLKKNNNTQIKPAEQIKC